jgi:hypothetical protein
MVATQQVRKKCDMRPNKECLVGLTCGKWWLCLWLCHTTESTAEDRANQQIQLTPTDKLGQFSAQVSSNHVRVHAAHDSEHSCQDSFTLYRGHTHSPLVMTILDSRIHVVQTSTLTHFGGVR